MPRRRNRKGRQPNEIEIAGSLTILWVLVASGLPTGGQNVGLTVLLAVPTVLAWVWAFMTIQENLAAGKTLEDLQSLSPDRFEQWVAARFEDMGCSVETTGTQGDHGVDLVVRKGRGLAIVQCKNYRAWKVGEPTLRDLYGAMHDFGADRAYLVTTGRLTSPALEWVRDKPIRVWDGDKLVQISRRFAQEAQCEDPAPGAAVVMASEGGSEPSASLLCPRCGSELVERRNRTTGEPFLGCATFPRCRYTERL